MSYQHQLPWEGGPLQGTRYLAQLAPLLKRLRPVGTERDKAGNREFFLDQYAGLLLLYFFNATVTSARGLQKMTTLTKVQAHLDSGRISRGALSEAGQVFDPEPVREIMAELALKMPAATLPTEQEALRTLTAVDGSLLPALPRMVWALWQDETHRAAKLHLHFEVARGIPVEASVTLGHGSEVRQLRQQLQAGRLYVLDRGYAAYGLLADILKAHASFIVRVQDNAAFTVAKENAVSSEVKAVGVVRDVIVDRLGSSHHKQQIRQPLRLIEVISGASRLLLLTDKLDWPAELVALAYRYRWTVELFFRWLKCILGCRHWLGESLNAVTIQVYMALIVSLLLAVWTNRKPDKRTFEMVCHYFAGWATAEELQRHIYQLQQPTAKPA